MAKRRKEKDEEEEFDFKIPKFDEEKFIQKERRNIKTTFISFIFGLIIAILSFGFFSLLSDVSYRWLLVFLFGFFCAAWLRYLFIRLNIDFGELGTRGQFSSFAIYFFTWLLILIVLVNPPFYDEERPKIEYVVLPSVQEPGGTVKIIARITDNAGISNIDFKLNNKTEKNVLHGDFTYEENYFIYEFENPSDEEGTFTFSLTAEDNNELINIKNGSFEYSKNAIKLAAPLDGSSVTYATTIKFDVKSDADRVYYTIDNGREINVSSKDIFYETYPRINGWIRGKEVILNIYAENIHYFRNSLTQFNNTIIDSDTYTFNVSDDPDIGTEQPPEIKLPKPKLIQVPGFELIIFLISLIGVVIIFKKRKNIKNK